MPARVQGFSKIESITGRASFFGFTKVVSLTFESQDDLFPLSSSISLVLQTAKPRGNFRVQLRFTGVINFELRQFGGYTQILGFDVLDVSDRQWDGIKFEVIDNEDQKFHFLCETAEVEYVENIE
jgi:hypothetical protein